jgi:hypothetical protein
MSHLRVAPLSIFVILLAAWSAASGQSVRSTRSGLVYFFEGYVFIGDDHLQPKFGRFQEIGEGQVLRTELGRAEVLLTPGVFLRVDENSAIRMLSSSLSDTRIEFLRGSAIVEVSREAANPPDTLIYKGYQVRILKESVARIDSEPAQLRVYSGTAEVSEGTSASVTVQRGDVLPLASVLVAEPATAPAADSFNIWAMNRSSVVSEDNTIAAGITDDPDQIDTSGTALGSFSYFPPTGIPSLGITYPYGLSFWTPYDSGFNPWLNPYLSAYPYGLSYRRFPASPLLYQRPIYSRPIGISTGSGAIGRFPGSFSPRPSLPVPTRSPAIAVPHSAAPHVIRR